MNKPIISLLILLISGCASVHEKYNCKKFADSNFERCVEKSGSSHGYYNGEKGWLLEPNLISSKYFPQSKRMYFKEKGSEFYLVTIIGSSSKPELTPFISLLQPSYSLYDGTFGPAVIGLKKDGSVSTFDEETGQIRYELPRLDFNSKNEFGEFIPALISNFTGGYWARHNENGKKYYRYYLNSGGEWTGKRTFPAENVRVVQSVNRLILLEVLDENKKLYWPIIKMSTEYLERPSGVNGLHLWEEHNWQRYSLGGGSHIPTVSTVYYEIQKGDKKVYRRHTFFPYKWNRSKDISDYFANIPESAPTYTELDYFKTKRVSDKATVYELDAFILKDSSGSYMSNMDNNKFETQAQLIDHLKKLNANIGSAVAEKKIQNQKDAEEKRIRDALMDQEVRAQTEALRKEQADRKAAIRAQNKAASDAAWSGVSDQLQNRARKADTKADCLNKRTKKKQNFLDKKQNWYQDYDC